MNNTELFIKLVEIYLLMNESPNIDAKQAIVIYDYAVDFAKKFRFSKALRELDLNLPDIVEEFIKQCSISNYDSIINKYKVI